MGRLGYSFLILLDDMHALRHFLACCAKKVFKFSYNECVVMHNFSDVKIIEPRLIEVRNTTKTLTFVLLNQMLG